MASIKALKIHTNAFIHDSCGKITPNIYFKCAVIKMYIIKLWKNFYTINFITSVLVYSFTNLFYITLICVLESTALP